MVKKYFLTGLIILLPLVVTLALLFFIINFLTQPFMGLIEETLTLLEAHNLGSFLSQHHQLFVRLSQIAILILLFFLTILIGMVTRWVVIKSMIRWGDSLLHRIPIINKVYKTSQDLIKTVFTSDTRSFKQVVMVPWPRDGSFALGFISGESPTVCAEKLEEPVLTVFIPTAPSPLTGFLVIYKKSEVIPIDMRVEEMFKYVISCGIIHTNHSSL